MKHPSPLRQEPQREMNLNKLKLSELLKLDEAADTIHFQHRRMLPLACRCRGVAERGTD